jgi:polyphosphate kinase 2 (PPK2 family)
VSKKNDGKRKKNDSKKNRDESLGRKEYMAQLRKLQVSLCDLQDWVKQEKLKVAIVFEGRDAAGGEVVLFDRSWYNRAGVEPVMGFCTQEQTDRFLETTPVFEKMITDAGIILLKYWLEVSNEEQERRFKRRINDPLRQWKLSPMDLEARARWYAYSRARDKMLAATDMPYAPWYLIRSDDKRRARLNCIHHLLSKIPHEDISHNKVKLPPRSKKGEYDDQASLAERYFIPSVY